MELPQHPQVAELRKLRSSEAIHSLSPYFPSTRLCQGTFLVVKPPTLTHSHLRQPWSSAQLGRVIRLARRSWPRQKGSSACVLLTAERAEARWGPLASLFQVGLRVLHLAQRQYSLLQAAILLTP